tara:strand:- start:334 stop:573 length:240 start_codon:yes stop_codon:yes gene_type:complete
MAKFFNKKNGLKIETPEEAYFTALCLYATAPDAIKKEQVKEVMEHAFNLCSRKERAKMLKLVRTAYAIFKGREIPSVKL